MSTQEQVVYVTGPSTFEVRTQPANTAALQAGEVAGRTLYSLISAGTELAMAATAKPGSANGTGYAACFRIDAVGSDVNDHRPGDVVMSLGNHRSHQRCQAKDVLKVPAGLDPAQATFARLMNVTMSALTTTAARPPAKVIVAGLGLVGHMGAQIFARAGYEVLACDPVESRRELAARKAGCAVASAIPLDDPNWKQQVDLVIECAGHEQAVLDGCKIVRKGGEVSLVGVPWARRTEILAFDILHAVFHNYVNLRSGWEWEVPFQPTPFSKNSILGQMAGALRWLAEGSIDVTDLYELHPAQDAPAAYEKLRAGKARKLGIVLTWE